MSSLSQRERVVFLWTSMTVTSRIENMPMDLQKFARLVFERCRGLEYEDVCKIISEINEERMGCSIAEQFLDEEDELAAVGGNI